VGFVDLHSHVLFGLDDGARDISTSRAMLGALAALGFTEVYATPHQKAGQFMPSRAAIDHAYAAVRGVCAPDVTLGLAAENMWDDVFYGRMQDGTIPSYNGGDAFLVELRPPEMPVGIIEQIFKLRMSGKAVILAHPERYEPLWKDERLVEQLRAQCAFVCDLAALAGYHGKQQQKMARRFVEEGIACAVTSDAHTVEDVRTAAEGIAWIQKRLGKAGVTRLLDDGPRMALLGDI
jgi:protein-tyrosine phosphatase